MAGFRQIGVVEGFYGRVWSGAERRRFIEVLAPFGLNTYLYCPKHEPALAAEVMRPPLGAHHHHARHKRPPFSSNRLDRAPGAAIFRYFRINFLRPAVR